MALATRGLEVTRELGMVLPRTMAGLGESTGWAGPSIRGARQFGEVLLDEVCLSGFTLLRGGLPGDVRSPQECADAAEELSALGIDGAHADPKPLRVTATQRRRLGRLAYDRVTFEHDPALPRTLTAAGHGGTARAVVHVCRHTDGPRPWLVWVHGAGQGGVEDLLVSRIGRVHHQLGFNVALPVQPGHGCRRTDWPAYPDLDPLGNVAGMMRWVSEVRAVVRWLRPQASVVAVAGISMGSPVAALVSHLEQGIDAVALYTPILGLNSMIAQHLSRRGNSRSGLRELLQSPVVAKLTSVIDPLLVEPVPPPPRRLIVGAWHDRMAMREPAVALQQRWGGRLYWHDGSHVGQLLAGRPVAVTERFLREVAA